MASLEELIAFNDEMALLTRVGVPIDLGLSQLSRDPEIASNQINAAITRRVQNGVSLVDAMAETERQMVPLKNKEFENAWREAQKNGMQRIEWPKDVSDSFFNDVMDESWKRVTNTVGEDTIKKMRPMMSK